MPGQCITDHIHANTSVQLDIIIIHYNTCFAHLNNVSICMRCLTAFPSNVLVVGSQVATEIRDIMFFSMASKAASSQPNHLSKGHSHGLRVRELLFGI